MHIHWHDPVLAFFGTGFVAGCAFAVTGPIAPIRVLGLIALACGALGMWVTVVALRSDDLAHWISLRNRGSALFDQVRAKVRTKLTEWAPRHAAAE